MKLSRYVIAYGGEVSHYLHHNVTHYISLDMITEQSERDIIQLISPKCIFIKPNWLYLCINNHSLMKMDEFLL